VQCHVVIAVPIKAVDRLEGVDCDEDGSGVRVDLVEKEPAKMVWKFGERKSKLKG
jgi:hypothetical protein